MDSKSLVAAFGAGQSVPRPPYMPLLGTVAPKLAQVPQELFASDAQTHARALVECATALGADAITVGMDTPVHVAADAVVRMRPLAQGKAIAGIVAGSDVAAVRAYCDAGVDLLFLIADSTIDPAKLRTAANACRFYRTPIILVSPDTDDTVGRAREARFDGALVPAPSGQEPGLIGGGLSASTIAGDAQPSPPRDQQFFWSFGGPVPDDIEPEQLAELGSMLTR
jgi:hypothetical protein